ncbi:MAG TPA: S8 family serine peptidase [Longimicrobium sp.]|nr:S8 family serine peptidase [Longimicrobium sp.]
MSRHQHRGGAKWRLLAATVAAVTIAGCDNAEQPLAPNGPAVHSVAAGERPFYYYQGERIPLEIIPTEISVTSALPPEAAARAVLATVGVRMSAARPLPGAAGHWLLQIAPVAGHAKAAEAARALRADARFGFAANVYRLAGGEGRVVLLDRVAVRLADGWRRDELAKLNAEFGTRVVREPQPSEPNIVWLGYKRGSDPLEVTARLYEHPLVEWADADRTQGVELFATPTDPFYGQQYYARNPIFFNGVRVDVNAEWAWDLTYGAWSAAAGPLTMAVLDDGVETAHPDLGGGAMVGFDANTGTWDAWGCTNCASSPSSAVSHGTLVAGIIKAEHNNGIGLAGIAPAVRLFPIRISAASACNIGWGINNAWFNGAHVMNNSWGWTGPTECITSAINRATTEGRNGLGTVMVFAAGNPSQRSLGIVGPVAYPGSLPNVLTVGAINHDGFVTDYSPNGDALDVVAPSGHFTGQCIGNVVTTDLLGGRGCNDGPGGDADYSSTFSGTSAAAPQVASVAAMVMSREPSLTEAQIRARIKASADPWGPALTFGAGKVNAYRALVGRVAVSITGPGLVYTADDYTWTASATGGAGNYAYVWEREDGDGNFYQVATGQSYSSYVSEGEVFTLRVTVTDGPDGHTGSRIRLVRGPSCSGSGRTTPC